MTSSLPPPRALSELIGLVYDAATDLSLWPELLEGVSGYLQQLDEDTPRLSHQTVHGLVARWFDQGALLDGAATPGERQLLQQLIPHFVRANAIHHELAQAEEERDLLESALDRLPVGMAIVDRDGRVSGMNRALLEVTRGKGALRLEQGRLVATPAAPLQAAIRAAIDQPDGAGRSLHLDANSADALSLLVSRMALKGRADASRAVVFVASRRTHQLSEQALMSAFGLTPAEARVTQGLVRGRTLEQIARAHAVTIHTTRAQLKAVFAKTGVRRQPELLQTLYSSPVWLDTVAGETAAAGAAALLEAPPPAPAEGLRLRDGRWLAYADVGDPGDLPVILMHGISGSRFQRHPDDSLLPRCGVRLILPERPGCGDSDPQPGRRIADWPRDVAALADHLGLDRFAVAGFSGGTPYALATAALLPERVSSVTLVGCAPPFTSVEDIRHYLPAFRMAMLLARYTPSLLAPVMRVVIKGIRNDPQRYIEQVKTQVTDADRAILDDPALRKAYVDGLLASVRHDERELVLETLLSVQDWGFELSEVRAPVTIWHGEDDRHVSIALAERIGRQLKAVALNRLPQAGHFVIYALWQTIFSSIAAAERQAREPA
ncbi:alpha/beta fold hydrolase [Solimonas variicoloris]|uniref:alpha/beta fold hydrolase n=1 Tax=Solimonas variicoloris TaxID=254408 RepID=UPI0003722755|nr:alpha/beta fold hydrolase [Solimonas variicoloris]